MKLNKTDVLIMRTLNQAYGPQTVSEIYANMPANLFRSRNALSARLCEMRSRNLLTSKTPDSGVNEWLVSDSALMMLPDAVAADQPEAPIPEPVQPYIVDIPPDISADAGIPVSEQNQPDNVDILPDISDPIAADFAAALEAAEVVDTERPPYDDSDSIHESVATALEEFNALGTPICADIDEIDATPEVAPDLIEEAHTLRLHRPLPREQDALFVLSVLIDTLGRAQPAMAYELTRIAAYIEGECA